MTGVTRADIQCGTVKVFKEPRWNWNGKRRCVFAKLAASVEKSAFNSVGLTAFFLDNLGKSRHQKGKTILYFNEARDDGVAVVSAGPYASRFRQITTPAPHHCILQAGCSFWRPTNSVKALKVTGFVRFSTPASILKDVDITQLSLFINSLQQGVKLNQ